MATTTVTITGDVSDMIGSDFDTRRTKVWIGYNTTYIVDPDAGHIRLGSATITPESDGSWSLPDVIASADTVENLQATVYVDYDDRLRGASKQRQSFGPYDLSGETGTVDITELETVQHLDATAISQATAALEALVDEGQELLDAQVVISGLTGEDDAVALLVNTPSSDTATALTASIEDVGVSRSSRARHAPALGLYFPEAEGAIANSTSGPVLAANAVALQGAIDAARDGGGTVVLAKDSVYSYSGTGLTADFSEMSIRGASRESSTLDFRGTGTALASVDAGIVRHWALDNLTIDTRNSGADSVGLQLADVYAGNFSNLRLRCTGAGNSRALRLVGYDDTTSRSTYYNHFWDLRASANGSTIEFVGGANAQQFHGGLIEGAGAALKATQGNATSNLGGSGFFGTAFQMNTTAGSNVIDLGMDSGYSTNVTGFQFIGCRFEAFNATVYIRLRANCNYTSFIGGTKSSEIDFVDAGSANTIMMPSASVYKVGQPGTIEFTYPTVKINIGGDSVANLYRRAAGVVKTDGQLEAAGAVISNQGGANSISLSTNTISAVGSSTDQTININSKGANRVQINVGGTATGGTQIEKSTGKIGFFGTSTAARPAAYTQTYTTATRTHSIPTATSVSTTGATQTTPYGFTTQAQADALVSAVNALITDLANTKQVVNSLIDDGQTLGLLQ